MFKINEYVVYNSQAICVVDSISQVEFNDQVHDYYILNPVYENNSVIKIPVNHSEKVKIRRLISKKQARELIESMPGVEINWIDDKNQRATEYKRALRSGCCEEWIKLTKTLFNIKKEKIDAGKHLSPADEAILSNAEQLLYGELALTLDIPYGEVPTYIEQQLEYTLA